MGKVTIWNEATGWTVIVTAADGEHLERSYISGRNHISPHRFADDFARHYGRPEPLSIEYAGNSPDYDREIAAIAADPYFMS